MPKVNEYYSQVRPSTLTGGAIITNPEAIANTGEQYVANAIGDLGNLTFQLAQKEMAFNDSIASAKSTQIMRQAELDYQAKIEQDPDTNNWSKYQQESIQKANQEIGKLKFGSGKGKKANEVESQAWGNLFGTQAQVQMIKQKKQDTLAITEANYEVAVTSMDNQPTSITRVAQTGEEYKKALYAVYPKELADKIFLDKDARLKKAMAKDAVGNMAVQYANQYGTEEAIKHFSDPKVLVENGIPLDEATAAINNLKTLLEQNKLNQRNEWDTKSGEMDADLQKKMESQDYTAVIKSVSAFEPYGEFKSQQVKWKQGWIDAAEKKLKGTENITDVRTYVKLDNAITDLSKGNKSYDEVRDMLLDSRKNLSESDFGDLRTEVEKHRSKDTTMAENKKYFDSIEDLQQKGLFVPSEKKMQQILPAGELEKYNALEQDQKDSYRANYSIQIKLKTKNEFEKWLKDNPTATEAQKEERFTQILTLPAQEKTQSWISKLWINKSVVELESQRFPNSVRRKGSNSPYPDYPDAYQENGKWYVMKDGLRYRIDN